jgi:hypothetical protein
VFSIGLPKHTRPGEKGRGPTEIKSRFIHCTPLMGSDHGVGVWMIILVPVNDEKGHRGYGRSDHEMVDYMGNERKKFESGPKAASLRSTQSIDGDSDGAFGLRRNVRSSTVRRGRGDSENQLYAEYLRSSSSTGASREEVTGTRKNSLAGER